MTTDVSSRQVQLSDITTEQVNAALLLLCQWINEVAGIGTSLPPGLNMPAWVFGTTNEITVTDNGDGTVTLSTPQQVGTASGPTFASLTVSGLSASSVVATSAGKVLETPATLPPITTTVLTATSVKVYGADGYLLHGFGDVGA